MNFWLLPLWIIFKPNAELQKTSASWASWHFTFCHTSVQGKKKCSFSLPPPFCTQHFCVQAFFTTHSEAPPPEQLQARLSSHGLMVILFWHKATLLVVGVGLPSSTPDRLLLPPPLLQQRCNHVVSWIREPILLKISHHCKTKHERWPKGKRNSWEQGWGRGWAAQPPSAAARTSAKWYMVMIQPRSQMKFQSCKLRSNPLWPALSAKVLQCLKTPWSKRNKWLSDSEAADRWASSVVHPCLLLPRETPGFLVQFSWKLHWCFNSRDSWHGQAKSMARWCPNMEALFHPHVLLNLLLPPPLPPTQYLICSHHCMDPSRFLITIVWEKWDTHFSVVVKY